MVISASLSPHLIQNLQSKDPKEWDSIIQSQIKLKNDQAVLNLYTQMEILGVAPNPPTLPLVLKACTRLRAIERGKTIHSNIQNTWLARDVRIRTALIDFYAKSGLLEQARQVFDETTDRDVVSWNAMICGYAGGGSYEDAIRLFYAMNAMPSSVTLVGLLLACGEMLGLRLGQEIHCYCLRRGLFDLSPHVGTALITFYSKFDVRCSSLVFDSMVVRNAVSWNALLSCYFNMGGGFEALGLFTRMLLDGIEPSPIAVLVAIQSCVQSDSLDLRKQIHQLVIKLNLASDLFIVSALVKMYGKMDLESSSRLFETLGTRDAALWNAMMSIYKECGYLSQVFSMFGRMRSCGDREDPTTVAIVLSTIAESANDLRKGRGLHAHVRKSKMDVDGPLGNALLTMYSNLNCVGSAERIFNEMKKLDVVSWNTLILALAHRKLMGQLWSLFQRMQQSGIKPNSFTMVAVLAACKDKTCWNIGRSIHGYVLRRDLDFNLSLCTGLTEMYMNCGDEKAANYLFEGFPNKDLVSWNALLTCYVDNDRHNEALLLFYRMLDEMEPNSVTVINILSSCAHLASLPLCCSIHAYAVRREFGLGSDINMGNALVTAYARCGSVCNAEKVFRSLLRKDVITWNSMIAAYGMHGRGKEALIAFSQMKKDGLTPTSITFVSVLSACSHAGLIQEGRKHFYSMAQDYNITPEVVHYACMVDLLGRGGLLDEAHKFINEMPIKPDASVWRALLGGCRVYSEAKLAKSVFKKLVELEPRNVGNYILLSNIYAAGGLWEEVRNLRSELKNKNLTKPPGNSWIVIRSQVHKFAAGDTSHPQSNKIYAKLTLLKTLIMENGYVPDRRWVLHDIKDEEKDQKLFSHSEKLAIAFGLLNTNSRTPILINKNLRVCGDCHTFSKHISKCIGREIILRDTSRFHHFVNGVCSCNDYW